jgi:UDP-glucuronate decarboxylase
MLEIAQRIGGLTGSSSGIVFKPLPMDDPWHRKPDISRAVDVLNWRPVTSLDEGLTRTAQYFRRLVQQRDSLVAGVRHALSQP